MPFFIRQTSNLFPHRIKSHDILKNYKWRQLVLMPFCTYVLAFNSQWGTWSPGWRWCQPQIQSASPRMAQCSCLHKFPRQRRQPTWHSGCAPVMWMKASIQYWNFPKTVLPCSALDVAGKLPDHVKFSFVLHEAGDGVGREHTGSQGEVGVDHCCELSVARISDGRVKTGPEHPQEHSSYRKD